MMKSNGRINFLLIDFFLIGFLLLARLFWWQVVVSEKLIAAAESQHWTSFEVPASRGKILASDGFPLATNKESFLIFASLPDLADKADQIAQKLAPVLEPADPATMSGLITERLGRQDLVWVPLKHKISGQTKEAVESLQIKGLGFEEEPQRDYPEGSVAAQLLGFVGADINGQDKGYFGLEGYYDLELKGQAGILRREKDALGRPILVGEAKEEERQDGRDLLTTIDRVAQFTAEKKLQEGIRRYGAKSGSVVIMAPQTGAILAMASFPGKGFPNPVVAAGFEPGSIFKVLVMAAALNEGVVTPETRCDHCDGPRVISGETIKTWDDKYPADPTMTEVIQQSNNVGMVYAAEKLGKDKLISYLQNFGLNRPTGIDLQDEAAPKFRPSSSWREIDLATASFGQGIAVTPIQMLKAVGVIANQGQLMRPFVVKKVISGTGETEIKPQEEKKAISAATARVMTEIMVNAVDKGEAKWAKPKGFRIAGKTGTAQIPLAGHYDAEKTIASFVGFAPADDPQFVMLVTLVEPTSSPWGSETAAPLWFDIAGELLTYWGILPS